MPAEWISAAEAARRMGVKKASLYSYGRRGMLARRKAQGSRASLFSASEVEGLARRGRPRRAPGAAELVIETELTEITGDHLRYRGIDAIGLARTRSFEQVACLLWTGSLDEHEHGQPARSWEATGAATGVGTAAQAALPSGTLPLERLQVIVPALAATDPLRLHLDPPAVIAAGRCLIAGMVDCLPVVQHGAPDGAASAGRGVIAGRLVPKLCETDPGPGLVDAVRAALVLLADHELAASTLAARVAASVRADPYAVVATGLGAVGGSLHGGASFGAEMMLRAAGHPADAARVVGDLLLFELIRAAAPESERLAVVDAVIAEASRRALPEPNIDFALATLAVVAGMTPGSGEAMFAVARAAGWLAHALEEYARNTPIRPRGIYTGPPPRQLDAPSIAP